MSVAFTIKPGKMYAPVRIGLALLLSLIILGLSSSIAVIMSGGPGGSPTLIGFLTHAGILVLSLAIILILSKGRWANFGLQRITGPFPIVPLIGAAGLGIAGTLTTMIMPGPAANPADGFSPVQIILLIWIWASLAEETLFRGLIQGFLSPLQERGITIGSAKLSLPVMTAAILFAIMHLGLLSTGASLVSVSPILTFALFLGILAGYYREKTESLLPAIMIHMSGNIGGAVTAWVIG